MEATSILKFITCFLLGASLMTTSLVLLRALHRIDNLEHKLIGVLDRLNNLEHKTQNSNKCTYDRHANSNGCLD